MKKRNQPKTAIKKSNSSRSIKSSSIYDSSERQQSNKSTSFQQLFKDLCKQFSQQNKNRNSLIQYEQSHSQIQDNLIGKIYLITGPSQCGKLSTVLFALRNSPKTSVLVINCNIYSTEKQFITKLLSELQRQSFQNDIQFGVDPNKVITQTINFNQITQTIEQYKSQFVIFLRNAEVLTQCNKQTILYNIIQWLNISSVRKKVGLVISSRKILLGQKFQKRVRSRFCGRNIQIFRNCKYQKLLQIISKRIDCLIQIKKGNKSYIGQKHQYYDVHYEEFKTAAKKTKALKKIVIQQISTEEQIKYLKDIKKSIVENKNFIQYLKTSLEQDNIITISFVLRIFQKIFASFEKDQFLKWDKQLLMNKISSQFKNNNDFQFPTYTIQSNYLANLNTTQIMLVIVIYSMIKHKLHPVKLKAIYQGYQAVLHTYVYRSSQGSSQQYHEQIVKRSLLKLYQDRIIKFQYQNFDIWNTQIYLLWDTKTLIKAINQMETKRNQTLPHVFQQIIKNGAYNKDKDF